jgi:hypothetical protein
MQNRHLPTPHQLAILDNDSDIGPDRTSPNKAVSLDLSSSSGTSIPPIDPSAGMVPSYTEFERVADSLSVKQYTCGDDDYKSHFDVIRNLLGKVHGTGLVDDSDRNAFIWNQVSQLRASTVVLGRVDDSISKRMLVGIHPVPPEVYHSVLNVVDSAIIDDHFNDASRRSDIDQIKEKLATVVDGTVVPSWVRLRIMGYPAIHDALDNLRIVANSSSSSSSSSSSKKTPSMQTLVTSSSSSPKDSVLDDAVLSMKPVVSSSTRVVLSSSVNMSDAKEGLLTFKGSYAVYKPIRENGDETQRIVVKEVLAHVVLKVYPVLDRSRNPAGVYMPLPLNLAEMSKEDNFSLFVWQCDRARHVPLCEYEFARFDTSVSIFQLALDPVLSPMDRLYPFFVEVMVRFLGVLLPTSQKYSLDSTPFTDITDKISRVCVSLGIPLEVNPHAATEDIISRWKAYNLNDNEVTNLLMFLCNNLESFRLLSLLKVPFKPHFDKKSSTQVYVHDDTKRFVVIKGV